MRDLADDCIVPDLGGARLADVGLSDVQEIADRMLASGHDPSTIRNAIMPLRVIYRRALTRGDVAVNPCVGLELPAVRGRRERIASPARPVRRAWKEAGLRPIGLHEARHTCASVLIAAGVNAKAITTFLGHSSIQVTFDRYGHLMPAPPTKPEA